MQEQEDRVEEAFNKYDTRLPRIVHDEEGPKQ
jgi:hypothetical protein